ncbi:MAG: PKD domain-containing protein [Acidobacteria bacterium]|nr:PKD domain-containing protein [Acidobacteriota bacterium]
MKLTPRTKVIAILAGLAVAAASFGPMAHRAEARNRVRRFNPNPVDPDGDGVLGEAGTIRARVLHELEMRGAEERSIDPQVMLDRARRVYARWLHAGGDSSTMGIATADWISLGPNNGAGRCTAIAVHPTQHGTILAGAAGGGVWKTTDGGHTWTPLTDGIPDLSVGAVTYAPSDPDIVYLGTGEGGLGLDFIPGIGLLRSDDGGQTWELPDHVIATQFYRINVDPRDPNTLMAATNQGLLRSTTGGATWSYPIPAAPGGGSRKLVVTDVVRSSQNPDLLYAALWCNGSCPAGFGRIMKSTNNGVTWSNISNGLPDPESDFSLNRTALAIAPSDDQVIYTVIEEKPKTSGEAPIVDVFRTANGGQDWTKMTGPDRYLGQQGWYDNTLAVSPTSSWTVIGGGVYYVLSFSGGSSWISKNPYKSSGGNLPHVDAHDLQWQGSTLWVACDGGIWKSTDNGATWIDCNNGLITRQYYSLAVDPIHRNDILAGAQDNGTNRRNDSDDNTWKMVIGGDGFECAINPLIPQIQYGSVYNTQIERTLNGGGFTDVSPPFGGKENPPFITPLTLRRDHPSTIYTGTNRVWESNDGGDTWAPLSKNVTNGSWSHDSIWAIADTPADPNVLMVAKGSNLYRTENGGTSWTLTQFGKNGLPAARVLNVEISPFDPKTALACLAVLNGDSLYRTTDGGLTWEASDSGLRPFAVQVARWDPTDPSTVYAGTDVGIYRSTDGGVTWQAFGNGLPAVSVQEIRILPDGSMMRIATHGRGVWGLNLPQSANKAPAVTITDPTQTLHLAVGSSATFHASATDPDGDPLSATWLVTDHWNTQDGGHGTGTLSSSLTHTFDLGGTYMVAVNVTDSHGAAADASVQVQVSDPADACASPRILPGNGPFPVVTQFSNASATTDASDPQPACIDTSQGGSNGKAGTMWVDFTPSTSGDYALSTCGSGADTVLSVYTGDTCGSYTAVDGGCNDDDDFAHCSLSRSSSYLELGLTAGTTYHIMISSYSSDHEGPITLTVDNAVAPSSDHTYIVPAAAHNDGQNGTHWKTDLDLYNPGSDAVTASIAFLPMGTDNTNAQETSVTVPARGLTELDDVVKNTFNASASGAIRVRAAGILQVSSRTYNATGGETFGQLVPGVASSDAVAPGGSVRLIGLEGDGAFRTNIGIASDGDASASAAIDLYDAGGTLLGTLKVTLKPHGWVQRGSVFKRLGFTNVTDGFAVVRNTSATAPIHVYASVVDQGTGDPTFVTAATPVTPDDPGWIAAAAHAPGFNDSLWRTNVELANPSSSDIQATLDFFPADQDNTSFVSQPVTVPAGQTLRLDDVLPSIFSTEGAGAIRVRIASGQLLVTSRTYDQEPNGTLGQFIASRPASAAITDGSSGVLSGLRRSQAFRTDIGMVNLTAEQITITAHYYRPDGTEITSKSYTLKPYSFIQNSIPVSTANLSGGFAILSSSTPNAAFLAYASVVDNISQDPTFIPIWLIPTN